jgi:hypothetical protein
MTVQQETMNKYLIPWLNFRLKNDCGDWFSMQAMLAGDATIALQQNCPSPITCAAPLGRKTNFIRAKSAVLKWVSPSCNDHYQVRWREASTTSWNVIDVGNATTYYLRYLTPGTSYEWGVKNFCDSAESSYSTFGPKKTFTTLLVNPSARVASDKPSSLNFTILPNPSNGQFEIKFEEAVGSMVQIEIYNTLGKLELGHKLEVVTSDQLVPFDLWNFPAGLYFVKVSDDTGVYTRRLVIQ